MVVAAMSAKPISRQPTPGCRRRGLPHSGAEAHQSPRGSAPSLTSVTGPMAWSPAAHRARGPAGREAPNSVRPDRWGGRAPGEVAGEPIARTVKTGWTAGQRRVTMSWARGTHKGGVVADAAEPPDSERRRCLTHMAARARECSRHGRAPNPPSAGDPDSRAEGTPGSGQRCCLARRATWPMSTRREVRR